VRHRLQEIAATATTAAEALDAGVDFLDGELGRFLGRLDAMLATLGDVCERLSPDYAYPRPGEVGR
jgi:hypothetical protein